MKKFILLILLFLISSLIGCISPPPSGVIEPDIENIYIISNLAEKYNDNNDEIIEWIINGTVTNNDNRTAEWIRLRAYFYDETGKHLQYHESYDFEGYLMPGESFDFKINWYLGDTEGDLIADIEQFPQEITYECQIINAKYSAE